MKHPPGTEKTALATPRSLGDWLPALLLAVGGAVYLAAFFAQPLRSTPEGEISRGDLLWLALVPDELVSQWVGGDFGQFTLLDRWLPLACAIFILSAAYGVGSLILQVLRMREGFTRLEHGVLAAGVGLNVLSLYTLLVGLCGGLHLPLLFWLPLGAASAYCGWQASPYAWPRQRTSEQRPSTLESWGLAIGGLFALALFLGAVLPPWDFDVREYHLQVPKEWFQAGRISFLPHNIYGNMPLGSEMHTLTAMCLIPGSDGWWWGALAGQVVGAAFVPLTALAAYAAGQRFASSAAGVIAALVVVSHPWLAHVSMSGLNEGPLAFYLFTAAYALLLARENRHRALVAGFLAGAAAACKYTGLLFVVAPLGCWLLIAAIRPRGASPRTAWLAVLLFTVGVTAGGGPWYAKNAALTGNPTYPLLYSLFDGSTRTPENDAQWTAAHAVPRTATGYRYSPGQAADAAVRIAVRSEFASPLLTPFVAALLVIAVWRWWARYQTPPAAPRDGSPFQNAGIAACAALLAFILAAWWLATHRLDRFLVPAIPLAAVLGGVGGAWFSARSWRIAVTLLLAVGLLYNGLLLASPFVADNRWFVPLAALRVDLPQSEADISRVSPTHRWLNENVAPNQGVLLVGDAQPFDLEVPALYNTCFDACLLVELLQGKSAAERRQALAERNIAYIVLDWSEIRRYRSPGNYGYDPRFQPQLVAELQSQDVLGAALTATPDDPELARLDPARVQIFPVIAPD